MAEQERLQERQRQRERSLQVLPTMLNLILVRTAKVFRDSARHTDRDVARPDAPVAQVVRVAIDRFHEALDVLEIDILRAKAALSMDLSEHQAREAEAKKQATAEYHARAMESPRPSPDVMDLTDDVVEIKSGVRAEPRVDVDVILIEDNESSEAPEKETAQTSSNTPRPSPVKLKTEEAARPDIIAIDSTDSKDDVVDVIQEAEPQDMTLDTTASDIPAQDQSTATSGMNEMDFDSMFPAMSAHAGASDMQLELSFSNDANLAHETLAAQGFAMNNTGLDMKASRTNDDMDALLPGLGSYANAVDDMATMEVPLGTTNKSPGGNVAEAIMTVSPRKEEQIPNNLLSQQSTNLDDLLFGSTDFTMDDGTAGNGGDGDSSGPGASAFDAGGEFDDAIFGLEGS